MNRMGNNLMNEKVLLHIHTCCQRQK
uniref:Uncharacterized protein n=1 Tax=Anguilla anguilla TaxID=7936 RepID=A0A0E9SVR0_ANGAN